VSSRAGKQAGRFKVRLGLGEIEGRDRDTYRYRETQKFQEAERQSC
jgi:hypothetical protein